MVLRPAISIILFSAIAFALTAASAGAALRPGQPCTAGKNATYKRVGLRCVGGHLKKIALPAPKPQPAPPSTTPDPPVVRPLAGHYDGKTSQGYPVAFDVQPDQRNLTNINAGPMDETCIPARAWQYPGFNAGAFDYPMGGALSWRLPDKAGSTGLNNGIATHTSIKMDITFTGDGRATGNYTLHTSFDGTTDTCDTSVTLTAAHT